MSAQPFPESDSADGWDVVRDFEPSYRANNTTGSSFFAGGHIHQPQPMRAIFGFRGGKDPRVLVQQEDDRTFLDEESYDATHFPGAENSLGLFSTDPKYAAAAAGSPSRPRHRWPTPPPRREIADYEREGGWSFDASGRTCYVPHGGIKEVDEDEDDDMVAQDLLVEETFLREQPLPPETTPPPRPVPRTVELVPLSFLDRLPFGDGPNLYIGALPPSSPQLHDFPGLFDFNDDRSTTPSTCSSPTILTQSQELNIVEQNLLSIMTGSLDIVSLHATFAALSAPSDADLALCHQVGEALHAVQESLKRRSLVSPEEWRLRSVSCQRKYDHRLMSLRKTLQRLHVLSSAPPRVHQFTKLRDMLKHYHAKLADLAAKFNATFDRLRCRHFSILLSSVYKDVQRRTEARKEERKTARAARRPYESVFHREGRRPSLVEVS
ncbi:hypothetical protein B0H17DRAFT_1141265 [Mycena rosella]|uniref:Uncharacterized protein n=1 Tax=Mycena rosella TaxID=1033263 RepID=A0AAD7D3V5_MYCRO|nr:hypothetical protein B0H17DRAFT_1141265 [Mycena rosella]